MTESSDALDKASRDQVAPLATQLAFNLNTTFPQKLKMASTIAG